MTTDLKYEDVIENANEATIDLNRLFNISQDENVGKQQRLVFLNKAQQNEKFLEKNVKKFTHLSARWLTVNRAIGSFVLIVLRVLCLLTIVVYKSLN